jgi:formylglycine-generating enzyme required for sulfatase activity
VSDLGPRYPQVRSQSEELAAPLSPEDCGIQSMEDASPTKWHLAHTSWYFETFVLETAVPGYVHFDPHFRVLFNSYYNGVGEQYARPQRGLLSRPSLDEVLAYRAHVDRHMSDLLSKEPDLDPTVACVIEIGLHHEQQHQELILTDLKHALAHNPTDPVYRPRADEPRRKAPELGWQAFEGGLLEIGAPDTGFAFDNERPAHRVYLEPFELADGWAQVQRSGWQAPLYWRRDREGWHCFTLAGLRELDPEEPICHVSFYEADAYARFAGARLPSEAEWEISARSLEPRGEFAGSRRFHPAPARPGSGPRQLYGDVWEWTRSPYVAYPGFRTAPGALGEYNGKFMSNQLVLRGGSCATPEGHVRASYRNFFYPEARWQFSGLRLARDR